MSDRMKHDLAPSGPEHGHCQSPARARLIHHSDRSSQYVATEYWMTLKKHGIASSMSGKGNCYEFKQVRASGLNDPVDHSKPQNTAVEAFFKTLKAELVWRIKLETREQAERIINDDILNFYNRKRRHSTLGNISPVEYEKQAA